MVAGPQMKWRPTKQRTRVMTRDRVETQIPDDLDFSETRRRAEQGATSDALHAAADDLAKFVKTIKRRSRQAQGP